MEREDWIMINIEGTTKLSEKEVMESLKKYFGKGGHGLEITEEQGSWSYPSTAAAVR